jgi:alcohol dehydrogenase (cytochrome c)
MKRPVMPCCALALAVMAASLVAGAAGLEPADIQRPLGEHWPTYSGDYTGRRYSALTQLTQANVRHLALAWASRMPIDHGGPAATVPTSVGGIAAEPVPFGGPGANGVRIVGSVVEHDGKLYATAPDHAWAVDARTGRVLWHYFWKTRGGTHIGNRGLALYKDKVFFEVPDDYLVALDANTGKELWHREIANFNQQYFSTMAPVVVDNHLIFGTGNDMDAPGYLRSIDPDTGADQWTWFSTPRNKGEPGAESWPNEDVMRHGGGNIWIPGVYDPKTHLYIFGTGNPNPILSAESRPGDNLYTCSIVALDVDTGKMAWYYQTSPHDTHDYDAAQTPVLVDAEFGGKMRHLVVNANRNGFFFVLDRETGEHLLTAPYSETANWATGINAKGQPVRNPAKDAAIGGVLVSPSNPGISNWPPSSYDPNTGLLYVHTTSSYSEFFLTDPDPRAAQGFSAVQETMIGSLGRSLRAIDIRTGKLAWKLDYPMSYAGGGGLPGLLTTAGGLLFGADAAGNIVARDPATGKPLWHAGLGLISNAPQTYQLDGRQYVLVASNETLYAFALN